jgi:Na+/melibiose symporter-like transporter
MESAERASRGAWRQGISSLGTGSVLFVIGLLLSTNFLEPDVPEFLQNLLGNGVFLVIAWIGLWYPLDLLFFARSPLRREMRALERMAQMPVVVRRRPAPASANSGA